VARVAVEARWATSVPTATLRQSDTGEVGAAKYKRLRDSQTWAAAFIASMYGRMP